MKRGRVCSQCLNISINPICPFCLLKEFVAWIDEKKFSAIEKRYLAKEMRNSIAISEKNNSFEHCILCHRLHNEICTTCFIRNSISLLKSFKLSRESISNFALAFNKNKYLVWSLI